jgi:hypothetical protein
MANKVQTTDPTSDENRRVEIADLQTELTTKTRRLDPPASATLADRLHQFGDPGVFAIDRRIAGAERRPFFSGAAAAGR